VRSKNGTRRFFPTWFAVAGAVAAVGLVAGGCGLGPIAVEDLGRNCPTLEGDRANSAFYFGLVSRVDRVDSAAVARVVREAEVVDEAADVTAVLSALGAQRVYADGRTGSVSPLLMGSALRGESARLPGGDSVLIAIRAPHGSGEAFVQFVVVEREGGEVRFAGDCADLLYRQPLAAYRDEVRPGDPLGSVLLAVIADEAVWSDFNDWNLHQGAYGPLSWDELPPRARQLDVEGTPEEVLNSLQRFTLELEVPTEWRGMPLGALCTFVSEGWNECIALQAVDQSNVASLMGWGRPGETVEVWLIDYINLGFTAPLALIGTFELPAAIDGSTVSARVVGGRATTLDEVVDLAGEMSVEATSG
jgi:hypothetical protein